MSSGMQIAIAFRSIRQADHDSEPVIERDQRALVDMSDHRAAFLARHGDDLIDHDLRRRLQAVRLARLDEQPVERRIADSKSGIGGRFLKEGGRGSARRPLKSWRPAKASFPIAGNSVERVLKTSARP
jgi:hypothetical protein